jgi:dienelactone hydrolase
VLLADKLKAYYPSSAQAWNYFDLTSWGSIHQALDQLHTYISLEGPFDGVFGFSHGAAFAATYIMEQTQMGLSPFNCAVFFSAGRPADPSGLVTGDFKFLDSEVDIIRIAIPTAHIWGANDNLYPGTWEYARLLCTLENREEVVRHEGHDIPSGRAKDAVVEMAKAVRRTIARADGWGAE